MLMGKRAAISGETSKKGRPGIDGYWVSRIYELAAKGWGPKKIASQLEKDGAAQGRIDAPSERTIRRYKLGIRAADLREYAEFHWPQAMLDGLLPWNAADFALSLTTHYGLQGQRRPSVKRVLWHWRISLARPHLTAEEREEWVNVYLAVEAAGQPFPDLMELEPDFPKSEAPEVYTPEEEPQEGDNDARTHP